MTFENQVSQSCMQFIWATMAARQKTLHYITIVFLFIERCESYYSNSVESKCNPFDSALVANYLLHDQSAPRLHHICSTNESYTGGNHNYRKCLLKVSSEFCFCSTEWIAGFLLYHSSYALRLALQKVRCTSSHLHLVTLALVIQNSVLHSPSLLLT